MLNYATFLKYHLVCPPLFAFEKHNVAYIVCFLSDCIWMFSPKYTIVADRGYKVQEEAEVFDIRG